MTRQGAAPEVIETMQDLAAKHNRVLLHALQTAHPVLHKEKAGFIHTLTFQIEGGGIGTTVYLTGDPTPLQASEVQLQQIPK